MSNAVEVNDSDFEMQIEQHKGLAVVDFWATWCAPCRMVAPVLDQLAIEYGGKAKVDQIQRALDSRNSILQGWEARQSDHRIRRQAGAGGEVQAARCGVISRVGRQTTREGRKGGDGRHARYSVPG